MFISTSSAVMVLLCFSFGYRRRFSNGDSIETNNVTEKVCRVVHIAEYWNQVNLKSIYKQKLFFHCKNYFFSSYKVISVLIEY